MSLSAFNPPVRPQAAAKLCSIDPRVDALRLTITRLARLLRKHSGAGLTPAQLSALDSVGRHGRIRAGRLAQIEGISRPTAARLTGKLEEMGLVKRTQDDTDARSWQVALTPVGEHLLYVASVHAHEFLADRISAMPHSDQRRLLESLPALVRLLDTKA
ncbi:MarR family winged helix-turn-helix transcriptional regulator [Arthrobacter sp. C152]